MHGLILGSLGPLRLGGGVHHLGRFSPQAAAAALQDGATMLFAVPTMYHRLASECEGDERLAQAFGGARLLVSGSAALPAIEHERIERLTGQRIAERYGMTETLMNTAVRAGGARRPGYVGPPLRRRRDPAGPDRQARRSRTPTTRRSARSTCAARTCSSSTSTGPTRPPRPSQDGWFRTGDLATRAPGGYIRIVGRRATDLIKTGGFKIGAGEIEGALLEHAGVAEAAVTGEPDPDLGERIVAWIVAAPRRQPERGRAGGARGRPAHPAQAPARRALPRRAAAQRDGQGAEAAPYCVSTSTSSAVSRGRAAAARAAAAGAGSAGRRRCQSVAAW